MIARVLITGAVIAAFGTYSTFLIKAGEMRVLSKIKEDRIVLMRDGKEIDDKVLNSYDEELVCLLVTC